MSSLLVKSGKSLGLFEEGARDERDVGALVLGATEGYLDGVIEGLRVGEVVGDVLGETLGLTDGSALGMTEGEVD